MPDARLMTSFRNHPKRIKLQRRLGAEGVLAFVDLILFASESRSSGRLTGMNEDDIAIAAQWSGDANNLISTLLEIGLLDRGEDETLSLHDWNEHNSYVSQHEDRRLLAKVNAHIGWLRRKGTPCSVKRCELCRLYTRRMRSSKKGNAPSPTPSHHSLSLSPLPLKKKERASKLREDWEPKQKTRDWAKTKHPDVNFDAELEAFRDWHIGKGSLWVDWDRALQTWIRRAENLPSAARPAARPRPSAPLSPEVQALIDSKEPL